MKTLYFFLILIAFISSINAQTKTAEPLSWKGAIIDVSRPDEIITKFGKPEKDEKNRINILNTRASLFSSYSENEERRVLKFKKVENADKVEFGFNKDNRLVFIKFNLPLKDEKRRIDVQGFLKAYETIEFKVSGFNLEYILVGKHFSGYLLGKVNRRLEATFENWNKTIFDKKENIEDFPKERLTGIVVEVQFISKSFENKDNTDVLK